MRFFNRQPKKSESSLSAENSKAWNNIELSSSDFDNQAKIASAEALRSQAAEQNRERQERKIISAFLRGNRELSQPDVNISDYEQNLVYEALANGTISQEQKSNLVGDIMTPVDYSPERTIDTMQDKHELRILAYLSGAGFDNWQSTSIYNLRNALDRFPTPYELKDTEKSFLEDIRLHNSPQKYHEYQEAMDSFKQKFYGKRLEYYNALESLQSKADKIAAEQTSRTKVLNSYSANQTPDHIEAMSSSLVELQTISPEEKQKILEASQVDGDSFLYGNQAFQLTPTSLEQAGLAPNYSFTLKNAKINLSDPYKVGDHSAVTAYVQTAKGTKVCSYYRSNSQGIWRYLPDYVSAPSDPNFPIDWFGKGYNEESLNLPSETQYALELINNRPPVNLDPVNATFFFAGTAKRYNSRDEYRDFVNHRALRGDHYQEVSQAPTYDLGKVNFTKNLPETLDITGPNTPNFQHLENPYTTQTNLYGRIQVEHFPSMDNSLQYTFNRDTMNRAWLGNIEIKDAPISSSGLRTEWASAGDYGTPLYEYSQQSDGYGDPDDTRGHYTNMWKNYLSRMPLIKKYLTSRQK